ncbi:MAG: mechanosensitive ion channel family protein [Acidobacteriota bacterium]|jgi:small-conductance mechanosensitive channel
MDTSLTFLQEAWARPWVQALVIIAAALPAGLAADFLLFRVLARVARRSRTELDDRLVGMLRRPTFLTMIVVALHVAARRVIDLPELLFVVSGILDTSLVFLWLGSGLKVAHALLEGLSRLAHRVAWLETRTLPLFDNLAKILLFLGAIYCLLVIWDLNVAPWLASAGIVGIAVGFAAKDTLANLFGGLFVIVDAPYQIGDYINLDTGERGKVVKIGLRSTRLVTRDDVEITVPNAAIAAAKIVNESGGPTVNTRVTVHVGVAYGSDVDRVREVLVEAARGVPEALEVPEPRVRFTELGDSALIFRVLCWVPDPELRGRCVDGINTAVYKALNREGVTIPFPQRDVHLHGTASSAA